jgi:hypothetical protein
LPHTHLKFNSIKSEKYGEIFLKIDPPPYIIIGIKYYITKFTTCYGNRTHSLLLSSLPRRCSNHWAIRSWYIFPICLQDHKYYILSLFWQKNWRSSFFDVAHYKKSLCKNNKFRLKILTGDFFYNEATRRMRVSRFLSKWT